ncbi:hypothetical protein [Thermophilibacter provencensis]|uniref:Uncharacterized protein n=1 Tax=Thermophilibacter provencensis TaxID=1852386 RepID=A0ABT7V7I5_9ACTN|nr:hypothetical protein [Thermophilibacter provencensis]MDM8271986.1 hypothetical protein [Thermophilibacter provencensis]
MKATGERRDIVWMVNGQERAFELAPEQPTLWLEESSSWGHDRADEKQPPQDDPEEEDGSTLIWLS